MTLIILIIILALLFGGGGYAYRGHGTSVERKDAINQKAYGDGTRIKNILNGKVQAPASANRLYVLLDGKV